MAVGTGHGTTVAWTTTTTLNALLVKSVSPATPTVGEVKTSHLGTTGSHTYIAQALTEEGEFTITYHYDPTVDITTGGSAETCTIAIGGAGTTNEWVGPCFRKSFAVSTIEVDGADLMTVDVVCKCTGAWAQAQN